MPDSHLGVDSVPVGSRRLFWKGATGSARRKCGTLLGAEPTIARWLKSVEVDPSRHFGWIICCAAQDCPTIC